MQNERYEVSTNLLSFIIYEMDHLLTNGFIQSSKMLLEGYITKAIEVKGSGQFNYTFTDKSMISSIKCFINPEPSIDEGFQYPITIDKYYFDHLITLSSSNELQSNLLLIIESYSIPSNDAESGQFEMKPSKNINYDKRIQRRSKEVLDIHLKKLLNENYYKLFSSNGNQANFLTGEMPQQKNHSVFKIISELFKVKEKGLLLQSKRGIAYPLDYFIFEEAESFEYIKSLNWKALLEQSTTLSKKRNEGVELFQPSEVINISDIKGNQFEKAKNEFLNKKVKKDTTTNEDEEKYPSQIKNLICNYGDLQANIGQSTLTKYLLYKKYMAIAEKEEKEKETPAAIKSS